MAWLRTPGLSIIFTRDRELELQSPRDLIRQYHKMDRRRAASTVTLRRQFTAPFFGFSLQGLPSVAGVSNVRRLKNC